MCGIAGIANLAGEHPPPSLEAVKEMALALRHRGPDEFGAYRDDRCALASARLSIVDLKTGQQPLPNEDKTLWIVFNGEIFNYADLMKDLARRGHRFQTHSDTEVVVHAYEEWGLDCFHRFNGQWALALWDTKKGKLLLSRDRVGVRPLHVKEDGGRIWFASESKGIFADPSVPRVMDLHGLAQSFSSWAPIAPRTAFAGIQEIPPGTTWTYERGGKSVHQYWSPSFPSADAHSSSPLNVREAEAELESKLRKAVQLRIIQADVPVGCYLSGGIDSSVIAWLGHSESPDKFRTFSIRFQDPEFDETEHQRLMASRIQSEHTEVLVTRNDIARVFPRIVWHAERPLLRAAPAPLFLLAERVHKEGIKAVLTGEGADEFLAGYDIFREAKIRTFWARQRMSEVRPKLFERVYPYLLRSPQHTRQLSIEFWKQGIDRPDHPGFSHYLRWKTTTSLQRFFSKDVKESLTATPHPDILDSLPSEFSRWDEVSRAQYLEIRTLFSPYIISSQGDRMLMAHSVEGRFPFLDIDVIDLCSRLPSLYKLAGLEEKQILKRIAGKFLPPEIVRRRKQPYRAPDAASFLSPPVQEYVFEAFSEKALREAGLFDVTLVRSFFEKCQSHELQTSGLPLSNSDNMAFVGILSSQLLSQAYRSMSAERRSHDVQFKTVVDRLSIPKT